MHINDPAHTSPKFTLFDHGFRPFFLLAGIYGLFSILVWGGIYVYGWPTPALPFSAMYWHAHEMIFGYGMAVAAGFLLTAVRNWTRLGTLQGYKLAGLSVLWVAARVAGWMLPNQVLPMALLDIAFDSGFAIAIFIPILRSKQHQQIGIASKIVLLMLANLCFYLGAAGLLTHGIQWGLYSGLYVMLALVFNMARRVLPFFIERGVGYPVVLKNRLWIDRSSLYLLALFLIADVFWQNAAASAVLAVMLLVVHSIRLAGWHTRGIWKKPMLWILYTGYIGILPGFLLKAIAPFITMLPSLALHAFALGGIGMFTVGMMTRISLAHTGRDIQKHSPLLLPLYALLTVTFLTRAIMPLIAPAHYLLELGIAQAAWLIAFALFIWVYAPVLVKPSL